MARPKRGDVSLPPGLYVRTFKLPKVGTIAAFHVPEAAKRYKASIGEDVHDDFLFMKPIMAETGDIACTEFGHRNDIDGGLLISGEPIHAAMRRNESSETLAVWEECRPLGDDEFFTVSNHRRSFDSRNYGTVKSKVIIGVHRSFPLLLNRRKAR